MMMTPRYRPRRNFSPQRHHGQRHQRPSSPIVTAIRTVASGLVGLLLIGAGVGCVEPTPTVSEAPPGVRFSSRPLEPTDSVVVAEPADVAEPSAVVPREPVAPDVWPELDRDAWSELRRAVPTVQAYRMTRENPVEAVRQFVLAVENDDPARLLRILHPAAPFPVPPTTADGEPISASEWAEFMAWQRVMMLGNTRGVSAWGAPMVVAKSAVTLVVTMAPSEAEVWVPVFFVGYVEAPSSRGAAGKGDDGGWWGIIECQRMLRAEADAAVTPIVARFSTPTLPAVTFHDRHNRGDGPAAAAAGPTAAEEWSLPMVRTGTTAAWRHLVRVVETSVPDTANARLAAEMTHGRRGVPADSLRLLALLRSSAQPALPPAERIAERVRHSLADAPTLLGMRVANWHVMHADTPNQALIVAETFVALDGPIGPPRLFLATWCRPATAPAPPTTGTQHWALLDWQAHLTRTTPSDLGISPSPH